MKIQRPSFRKTIRKNVFVYPPIFQVVCIVIRKERPAVQLKGKEWINILSNIFDSRLEKIAFPVNFCFIKTSLKRRLVNFFPLFPLPV